MTTPALPQRVLALDTSTDRLSVVLGVGGQASLCAFRSAGGPQASASLIPAIRGLLDKGNRGSAHLDPDGNVMMMVWVSERDYYDDQLYRCWMRMPPGCLYQFAGECAPPFRGSGVVILAQKMLWDEYREYKKSTGKGGD